MHSCFIVSYKILLLIAQSRLSKTWQHHGTAWYMALLQYILYTNMRN